MKATLWAESLMLIDNGGCAGGQGGWGPASSLGSEAGSDEGQPPPPAAPL